MQLKVYNKIVHLDVKSYQRCIRHRWCIYFSNIFAHTKNRHRLASKLRSHVKLIYIEKTLKILRYCLFKFANNNLMFSCYLPLDYLT